MSDNRATLPNRIQTLCRALVTHDVFPGFSARVRRVLYNPLGVLLLAALTALLCGVFLQSQGFVLCGGVVTLILLGTAWPWISLRGLDGAIAFETARACEGERVSVALKLRNRRFWPAWGLTVRHGFGASDGDRPVASIASTPGRRSARCNWWFVPASRGLYPQGAPCLTTGFPFGLWQHKRLLRVERPLIVWPRTFPVGPVPPVSGDQQVEGNVSRKKVGNNGDVLGVRPYRRGDLPRRIHWAQSARHDRLIVCELQANARPVVQLVLDVNPLVHAGDGPGSSREWAMRIVASLARGWIGAGAQVGAVWQGTDLPPASGQRQMQKVLDGLAGIGDGGTEALMDLLKGPACSDFGEGLQVVVTTDTALFQAERPFAVDDQRRWVILRAAAFREQGGAAASPAPLRGLTHPGSPLRGEHSSSRVLAAVRPWLWIESAEQIPALLCGGWKEAQHGS